MSEPKNRPVPEGFTPESWAIVCRVIEDFEEDCPMALTGTPHPEGDMCTPVCTRLHNAWAQGERG